MINPIRWLRSTDVEHPDEVPRRELSDLLFALWGQSHLNNMTSGDRFFHFCTNVLMLDERIVGTLLGAKRFFDAVTDPIAGAMIDSYRFRDGRKLLPWIKYTSPPIAILAFLLFVNWGFPSQSMTLIYISIVYILGDIFYSFRDAAIWGMTAAVSGHASQRARVAQWADLGGTFGGLLPTLTLPMLAGGGVMGLNQQQVYLIFALVLCLGGGFQSLTAMGMTERVTSPRPITTTLGEKVKDLWANVRTLRHNHIIMLFFASELLGQLSPRVGDVFIFQQMSYTVFGTEISAGTAFVVLGAITMLPGMAMKFFATKIADRLGGMKRVLIIARVASIIMGVAGFFVGVHSFWALALVFVLDGIANLPGSLFSIAQRSLTADSVEYVEWKIDRRTEGITMSMRNLMSKMGNAMRSFIMGYTLRWLQYDAELIPLGRPQNAHFNRWIWPVFRLGPVIGLAISLIPLLCMHYPESLRMQVQQDMVARRAAAEQIEEEMTV
ncbi:MAG: MFS transporter [Oscillospiraceae bacterium]|nr:MFS transporter [Oscillospiraceae bacterium]